MIDMKPRWLSGAKQALTLLIGNFIQLANAPCHVCQQGMRTRGDLGEDGRKVQIAEML